MKKLLTTSLILFTFSYSLSQELIPNTKGEESLIGKINSQIELKNITNNAKLFLDEKEINLEELIILNELNFNDIIEIKFFSIDEAKIKYGEDLTEGAVIIIPFIDETLSKKYYDSIENKYILETIERLTLEGKTDSNPILVLDGTPLRGEHISNKINEINNEEIKSIFPLDKKVGYKIYGIRAIPGVIIISLK